LFVIEILINYTPSAYQIRKAEYLLEDMVKRKNLDLRYDLCLILLDDMHISIASN